MADTGGKRRPGRAPGSPKVPGSGRKPGSRNHVSKDAKADVQAIIDANAAKAWRRIFATAFGQKLPGGRPSEAAQWKALELIAHKTRANLSEAKIDQSFEDKTPPPETDPLKLSRAVYAILRTAKVSEPKFPEYEPAKSDDEPDERYGGDERIVTDITVKATDITPTEPELGEHEDLPGTRRAFDGNGAHIELVEIPGSGAHKWEVTDFRGVRHGFRTRREDAVSFAQSLPGPRQDHEVNP